MHHVSQHLTNRKQLNWCSVSLRRDRTKERQYFWKVDLKRAETNSSLPPRCSPFDVFTKEASQRVEGKENHRLFHIRLWGLRGEGRMATLIPLFPALNGSSPSVLTPSRAHAGTTLLSLPFRDTHARSHWTRPRCTCESAHNARKHFAFVNMRKQRWRFRTYVQASLKVCVVIPIHHAESKEDGTQSPF